LPASPAAGTINGTRQGNLGSCAALLLSGGPPRRFRRGGLFFGRRRLAVLRGGWPALGMAADPM